MKRIILVALLSAPAWALNLLPEKRESSVVHLFGFGLRTGPMTAAQLATVSANDGTEVWCVDCQAVAGCTGGGSGAFAQRIGGLWDCAVARSDVANTWTATQTFSAGTLLDKGEVVFDARAFGSNVCDGTRTDDDVPINAAITAMGTTQGTVFVPAGTCTISAPITLTSTFVDAQSRRGPILRGAGMGATLIRSPTASTGFSMIRVGTPRTCTGGTGSCDSRIGTSGRGATCPCYTNTDCQSGTCAGGTQVRQVTIRDLSLQMRQDNMVGLDAAFMGESLFDNLSIFTTTGTSHTNTIGVLFGDGASSPGGYDNILSNSRLGNADVCVRIMKTANNQTIFHNAISSGCGTGIADEAGGIHIEHNLLQSTVAATCSGGTTCSGGYFHGKACAVAADCGEADLITLSTDTFVAFNWFEDSNNAHIHMGENSTVCATCGSFTAQETRIFQNVHAGNGAPIVSITGRNQRPFIFENAFNTTRFWSLLPQPPPWTVYGFLASMGQIEWAWQSRNTNAAATLDAIGMDAPVVTGTPSATQDSSGHYIQYASGAVSGNVGGLTPSGGTYDAFQFQDKPMAVFGMETGASVANVRLWLGLFSGDPTASSTPAVSYVAFRYDDSLDGTTWRMCMDNGSGIPTCTDTGITVSTGTRYDLMIYTGATNGGTALPTFYVNGALVGNATTPLPTTTTTLHAVATVTTRTTAAKQIRIGRVACATPGVNKTSSP